MHICHICNGKTYEVVTYGADRARFYKFYGYRGRVVCSNCINENTKDNDEVQEEEVINPS